MPITEKQLAQYKKLKTKKGRQKFGKFLVEGVRSVEELKTSDYQIDDILVCEERLTETGIRFIEKSSKMNFTYIDSRRFSLLADEKSSQGLIAIAEQKDHARIIPGSPNLILILERISDPSNLGSIIRSAVSFGVPIIIGGKSVELYSPKVISVSSGLIFKAQILSCPAVNEQINILRAKAYKIYGTDSSGSNVQKISWLGKKIALVIGNEAFGLSEDIRQKLDKIISIPIKARVDSLSAPVAAGIMLYAISEKLSRVK